MAKRKKEEYIFADSYLGNFAARLMTRKDCARVATSRSLEAAEAVLREFGYEEAKEVPKGQIDAFIRREEKRLTDEVFAVLPDPGELAFSRYPYDYHNIKVFLKAQKQSRMPDEQELSPCGSIPQDKLMSYLRDQNDAFLPEKMRTGAHDAQESFARGGDPQLLDMILDRACYAQMLEDAEKTEEPFLTGLVRRMIDALNLRTFARLRELGKSWTSFRDTAQEGGEVPIDLLTSSWEEPYPRVGEKLASYGFRAAFAEGGKALKDTGSFGMLERQLDDAVMEYVKQVKYESFGVNVIEGYLYAKQTELRNLRIALTACKYGFDPDVSEERLRETYV